MLRSKFLLIFGILFLVGCFETGKQDKGEVVVYTAVDQVFSSKILKKFEKETGIIVKALYDTEASKAVGLEKRLLAEKNNPRADVFWNSEFMRTARLESAGILASYSRDTSIYTSDKFYSPQGLWYGMGGRSRVFIVNTNLLKPDDYPKKLTDLTNPTYKGKIAISTPYSGTSSTHFAALYNKWGEQRFEEFLVRLKNNKIAILSGNSVVKNAIGFGKYAIGLVDTDDALVGIDQGLPLEIINYNQDGDGMFSFFQTLALVKGSKNPKNAKILINYLLNRNIENQLIKMNAVQLNILDVKTHQPNKIKTWSASPEVINNSLSPSITILRRHLE